VDESVVRLDLVAHEPVGLEISVDEVPHLVLRRRAGKRRRGRRGGRGGRGRERGRKRPAGKCRRVSGHSFRDLKLKEEEWTGLKNATRLNET